MKSILLILSIQLVLSVGLVAKDRPNVVLVMTDDQGYGDLSCHGNPVIKTPNIDKLYSESVRFTDFHVDPTCSPTRGALMTGKYSHRARVWHTISGGNHLRASEVTMANMFQDAGYRTGLFGKWHLGANYPYRPMDRGFDEWIGHGDGGTGTTDDWYDNDRVNDYYWHNGKRVKRDGFAPDVFFESAFDFIKQGVEDDEPFFVYLSTYLPHGPHTLPDASLANRYNSDVPNYVAHFFASIDNVDSNVGRLRELLEKTGQAENTIFIFMTDNGGTEGVDLFNSGMRGRKVDVYEGGHRVPFFIHWPDGNLQHGKDVDALTAHIDVLPTLIELCDLPQDDLPDFDGRSFVSQLAEPELELPDRTLFVETQRTFKAQPWHMTVGMRKKWRLVDNKELYDLSKDPGQQNNVFDQYPDIVDSIQQSHDDYWERVSPGDRDLPRCIVGHDVDPETFLSPSEWYLPDGPWNHAQISAGGKHTGDWAITVSEKGTYRFDVRRWPREADTPIQGIPHFEDKAVDAWLSDRAVDRLIYGSEMLALPIVSIHMNVGDQSQTKPVTSNEKSLIFEFELDAGDTTVSGLMMNENEDVLAGAYYVYITRLNSLRD